MKGPFAAALNHVLAQNPWAQARLVPYAHKTFQLRLAPTIFNFTVSGDGRTVHATQGAPDATLMVTPSGWLRYLAAEPRDPHLIAIEGDAEFGVALREILSQLTWEAEEDLSRLVGDVLAHRMVGVAKNWSTWRKQSLKHLALGVSEYFTEEQPLLAKPRQLAQFAQAVTRLQAAVDDLDRRIQKL